MVMGVRETGSVPPGMIAIVLKDRIAGDSAEGMVAVLYETLPNGTQRRERLQVPDGSDGWIVYVPAEDAAELQEVWKRDMQSARKNIEQQFKAAGKNRRAPRLIFQTDHQEESSGSTTTGKPGSSSSSTSRADSPEGTTIETASAKPGGCAISKVGSACLGHDNASGTSVCSESRRENKIII